MRDGQRFIQCKKKKNTVVFASRRVTAFFYRIIPFSFFNPTSVVLRTAFGLFPRQKHLVFPFTCTSPGLVRQELSISILPEREGACQLLSQKQTIREGTFKSGVVRALILCNGPHAKCLPHSTNAELKGLCMNITAMLILR